MTKFKHPEYAPGTFVFVARSDLTMHYPSLFEIEKREVIATTAKGYRLKHGGNDKGVVYTLDRYVVSKDQAYVTNRLLLSLYAAIAENKKVLARLQTKANDISRGDYNDKTA